MFDIRLDFKTESQLRYSLRIQMKINANLIGYFRSNERKNLYLIKFVKISFYYFTFIILITNINTS